MCTACVFYHEESLNSEWQATLTISSENDQATSKCYNRRMIENPYLVELAEKEARFDRLVASININWAGASEDKLREIDETQKRIYKPVWYKQDKIYFETKKK